MAGDRSIDPADARAALGRVALVRATADRAARASVRRHMVAQGLWIAVLMALTGAFNHWMSDGWPKTALIMAAALCVFVLFLRADQRRAVRALPARRPLVVTFTVNAAVTGLILVLGRDGQLAAVTATAALATLAVWGSAAWWVGR